MTTPGYPRAPRAGITENLHGTSVADPFRPLEDLDAAETRAWLEAQNALSERFLSGVPEREALRARLSALWDFERRSVPERVGDAYAYFRNTGLQNQAVLLLGRDLAEPGRTLLDPNVFSEDGTVALGGLAFSDDGRFLAYALSASGSDWLEWRVREVATGRDLPDRVRWGKFSGASWRGDGSGFWYSRYDEPDPSAAYKDANYNHQVWFHRLGTPQSADVLVYAQPEEPEWNLTAQATEDGRWLVIEAQRGTEPRNRVYLKDLASDGPVTAFCAENDGRWSYLANDGDTFVFLTTSGAPKGRIVARDARGNVREIVAESADSLDGAAVFGQRIIATYLHDATSRVACFDLDGTAAGTLELPGLGTVSGFGGKRGARETFYRYASYTEPPSLWRYDLTTGASTRVFAPRVPLAAGALISERTFAVSKDGTRVPIILTCAPETKRDGSAPAILYGYGGFDISLTPEFSPAIAVWCEAGGIYAVANLRGGGEYGAAWHEAGTRQQKQNVFDDFFACAEHLIAQRWTSTPRLAIAGGSNGGLLVGAALAQRPELFGAALPSVGVMDMLRFHKFTIGWAWTSDYGSPEDPDDFRALLAYSPYHNLRDGVAYPPTLITTGDHDDRVFPAHSFKFAARLQEAQGGDAPVLLRVDVKAGHGAGKPTAKIIDETADRYAFLARVLGGLRTGSARSREVA